MRTVRSSAAASSSCRVLPLVEVVADLFVWHGDDPDPELKPLPSENRPRRAASCVVVAGAPMKVDHARATRDGSDDVGDLGRSTSMPRSRINVTRHSATNRVLSARRKRGVDAEPVMSNSTATSADERRVDLIQVAGEMSSI